MTFCFKFQILSQVLPQGDASFIKLDTLSMR